MNFFHKTSKRQKYEISKKSKAFSDRLFFAARKLLFATTMFRACLVCRIQKIDVYRRLARIKEEFFDSRVVPVVPVSDDGYDRIRYVE